MGDISKLPHCRICGRKLKEISSYEAIVPLELVMRTLPSSVHPSSLRHFECPEGHGGIVLMPAMDDDEREREMNKCKHHIVN